MRTIAFRSINNDNNFYKSFRGRRLFTCHLAFNVVHFQWWWSLRETPIFLLHPFHNGVRHDWVRAWRRLDHWSQQLTGSIDWQMKDSLNYKVVDRWLRGYALIGERERERGRGRGSWGERDTDLEVEGTWIWLVHWPLSQCFESRQISTIQSRDHVDFCWCFVTWHDWVRSLQSHTCSSADAFHQWNLAEWASHRLVAVDYWSL